jgi:hypothetical protein
MKPREINSYIFTNDTVLDHMDDTVRKIERFQIHDDNDASVFMTDGGVIGLKEIKWNDESPSRAIFKTGEI